MSSRHLLRTWPSLGLLTGALSLASTQLACESDPKNDESGAADGASEGTNDASASGDDDDDDDDDVDDSSESGGAEGDDSSGNEASDDTSGAGDDGGDDSGEAEGDEGDSSEGDGDESTGAETGADDDGGGDDDSTSGTGEGGDDGGEEEAEGNDDGDEGDWDTSDNVEPSVDPPGGLTPEEAPMFVAFGFDDNAYVDAMEWFGDLVRDRKNPDGSPVRATFFLTAGYAREKLVMDADQTADDVLDVWTMLYQDGHEIANHTWSHEHGRGKSADWWLEEIESANELFADELGVPARRLRGFRTPFLEYDAATFEALRQLGMVYDCSVEFGYDWWQHDPDDWSTGHGSSDPETGKWYYWPYTLDAGPAKGSSGAMIAPSPGMWEVPVYTYNRLNGDTVNTITGFDFNMWKVLPTDAEFLDVLKFNFDQRYTGQRSPLTINAHTDYYSEFNPADDPEFMVKDYMKRRQVIEDFLDYALEHQETRVVAYIDVLKWMRDPVAWNEQ